MTKIYLTSEGLKELQNEQERILQVDRPKNIEELKAARELGDLSENADYDIARDNQAKIEARLRELEVMLQNVEIIEESVGTKVVAIGTTVKIRDIKRDLIKEFAIVGSVEADPINGKLSNVAPLAEAIMDKPVGTIATVKVAKPYDIEILDIK